MLKEYLVGILSACTFFAVLSGVAHRKFNAATRFGVGILMICVIMLPLVDIFANFDAYSALEELIGDVGYDSTDSMIELAFEDGVRRHLADKYSVDPECISVRADGFDMEKLKAHRIYVSLSGEAVYLDYHRIERHVEDEFTEGGKCEVSLNFG